MFMWFTDLNKGMLNHRPQKSNHELAGYAFVSRPTDSPFWDVWISRVPLSTENGVTVTREAGKAPPDMQGSTETAPFRTHSKGLRD